MKEVNPVGVARNSAPPLRWSEPGRCTCREADSRLVPGPVPYRPAAGRGRPRLRASARGSGEGRCHRPGWPIGGWCLRRRTVAPQAAGRGPRRMPPTGAGRSTVHLVSVPPAERAGRPPPASQRQSRYRRRPMTSSPALQLLAKASAPGWTTGLTRSTILISVDEAAVRGSGQAAWAQPPSRPRGVRCTVVRIRLGGGRR